MKESNLIAANTVIIWGTTLLQMIPPLILVPFLIQNIGDDGYGEYALIWSLLMAIEQLEMSLQSGSIKYAAAFIAQNRIDEVNKVLSSTFIFSFFLGLFSCLAINSVAFLSFNDSRSMMISLIMVGVMMLFLVPTTPFLGIIRAKQRHYLISLAGILSQYSGLLLVILWFRMVRPSVESLIAISAATLLISRLMQLPFAYRLVPRLQNRPRFFDWKIYRLMLAFGAMTVLSALCIVANTTGIRWLCGMLISNSFVAHLAIFLMPGALMGQIVQAMTITVMPAASAYEATQNRVMLQELFIKGTRYPVLLVSACLIVAVLLTRPVLRLWVGSEYEFLDVYALINLGGVAVLISASSAHHMLKGFAALRHVFFAYLVGLVVIPMVVFLVIFLIWKSPYMAISVGLFLGNISAGTIQIAFCSKAVQVNLRDFIGRAYIQPIAPAVVSLAFALGMVGLTELHSFEGRGVIALLSVILLFGSFYLFIAKPDERRQFKEFIQMIWGKYLEFVRRLFPSMAGRDV